MDGKIGSLAKEIAMEATKELGDLEDKDEFMKQLMKNPTKIMELVKNIGTTLETKIKKGDLKESELLEAIQGAKSEALKFFSNDKVLIEKYIVNPRHIEVQLMSDTHGTHLHFFERECSIQRRYQKVVEETPAPNMSDELRLKICETAVQISAGINYRGAGTIEFILAPDGKVATKLLLFQ